jgi:hypothetical protein
MSLYQKVPFYQIEKICLLCLMVAKPFNGLVLLALIPKSSMTQMRHKIPAD